jgi:hypothetical protein
MVRPGSSRRRRSRGRLLDIIDRLTALGLQAGTGAFVIFSGYLLFGMLSGRLAHFSALSSMQQSQVTGNVVFACTAMVVSGIVLIASAAIRCYNEEQTGYLMLIGGALLYWGMPWLISPFVQWTNGSGLWSLYIINQFKVVGLVGLAAATPFILVDVIIRFLGVRSPAKPKAAMVVSKTEGEEQLGSRVYFKCWQTPYCRDYLRMHCKAFRQKKACWRIKSGCYCDEGMILRALKKSNAGKIPGFDQRFSEASGLKSNLTAAQKRERCRQCFLYSVHQKQKYRMLSPIPFVIVAWLLWQYNGLVLGWLSTAMRLVDRFVSQVSFLPDAGKAVTNHWANAPSTSTTAEWLFLICLALVVLTYMLRFLEFMIFDLQI